MKYLLTPLAFAIMAHMASASEAHEWYGKKRDPIFNATTCCGGTDCGELPAHAIINDPAGLRIRLTLEEAKRINKLRNQPFDELIPFERIQDSEDGKAHICLMMSKAIGMPQQGFFCIFMPRGT